MRPQWGKEHAPGGLSLPLATASKRAVSQGRAFNGNAMAGIGGCLILGGPHPGLESQLSSSHAHSQITEVPDQDHETSRTSLARSDKAETCVLTGRCKRPRGHLFDSGGDNRVPRAMKVITSRLSLRNTLGKQDRVRARHRNPRAALRIKV